MNRFQKLWARYTEPYSQDPDEARREYMTRVVLAVIIIVAIPLFLVSLICWIYSIIPFDTVLLPMLIIIIFYAGLVLSRKYSWKVSAYLPIVVIFLAAVYGNYVGGMEAPALLIYIIPILLAGMLFGSRAQMVFVILTIIVYSFIALAVYQEWYLVGRSNANMFINRITIAASTVICISLLFRFIINQYQITLNNFRFREEEVLDLASKNKELYLQARQEISNRKEAEEELRESNIRLNALLNALPDQMFEFDSAGRVIDFRVHLNEPENHDYKNIKKSVENIFPPDVAQVYRDAMAGASEKGKDTGAVYSLDTPSGTKWHELSVACMTNPDRKEAKYVALARDISDRMNAVNALASSLEEKEILLREIHHRVKNNLNIVVSLLGLQVESETNIDVQNSFMAAKNRIYAIALIHEMLYSLENLSRIDFGAYIRQLIEQLHAVYATHEVEITQSITADDISLTINKAVPCAILINEIITNIYKHAFKGRTSGSLSINMFVEGDHYHLLVCDDGIGFEKDEAGTSLGLSLIDVIVKNQLNGSFQLSNGNGTLYDIRFPV